MTITCNGVATDVEAGWTIDHLVAVLALPQRGVAVALDGEVVPRSAWPRTALTTHARVEVVTAMQGG